MILETPHHGEVRKILILLIEKNLSNQEGCYSLNVDGTFFQPKVLIFLFLFLCEKHML